MGFDSTEPIAIVGSACRFPGGSSSPSSLWKLLQKPSDVSKDLSEERFQLRGYYHPKGSHHGTTNVQRAYLIDGNIGAFDASFFNISPNEAESMDPQQRLLMEVVYEALESGGHRVEELRGTDTGVYVGTMSVDYNDILLRDINSTPTYFSTGTSRAILSNRISYFFDWHGPSMTIDTACSSSMVALHQSVQSLRAGESRVAIAGGTELLLGPEQFVGESKMSLLSPTGTSRMWDASANGYARGDGIAAVVLKRLSDAIADGDHIESLIRGTGVNQDGKSTGLTVPSSEAQAALIRSTYARSGLNMRDPRDWPQFFEAHGTGTKAGDPREASAIDQCFGSQRAHGNPLYVGSIKTIIGHTEGTAGLAGVFKASLAIRHGLIPPNMLLNKMNEEVAQYCTNLEVPTSLMAWPKLPDGVPRRASVNSFGFGGTNGHAIVEAYLPKDVPTNTDKDDRQLFRSFPFSAASTDSLAATLRAHVEYLKTHKDVDLSDLAWTLQSRKSTLTFRTAFAADSTESLISKITNALDQTKKTPPTPVGVRASAVTQTKIMGVFTGQGAQWATMGAHLIRASESFRRTIEELDKSLSSLPESHRPSWLIADQLCAGKETSRLNEAALSQPLCTAIQLALVDLLRGCGITFHSVVGHSSGEIAAAYAAGFFSAWDAIRIAYYRGLYAKSAQGPQGQKGAMMAVGTSWEDAQELLDLPAFKGRVKIAAQNSAASLTLSGDKDGIAHAKRVFDEEKKFARLLIVDTAYHSHHMLKCSEEYMRALRQCDIQINYDRETTCTWYSSVNSGTPVEPNPSLGDTYWNDNMVNTVLFTDAVRSAAEASEPNFAIELGPHPALRGPAMQTLSDLQLSLPYTGVLKRNSNDLEALSDALGFIWTHLGPRALNFQHYEEAVFPRGRKPSLVADLPLYQWDHGRTYWFQSRLAKKVQQREDAFHELLGVPSPSNTDRDMRWTNFLKASEIPWLDGHQLQGQTVFPAAGYVSMALEAALKMAGNKSVKGLQIEDLTIDKATTFDDGANFAVETLVTLTNISSGTAGARKQNADFTVYSCPNTGTTEMDVVSRGKLTVIYGAPSSSTLFSKPVGESNMIEIDADRFYASLADLGYGYNGPFKTLVSTKRRLKQALAKVPTYEYSDNEETLVVHPTMLDVAFQASFLAKMSPGDDQLWSLHVPTSIKCIRVNPELCASLPRSATDLCVSASLHESRPMSMLSSVDIMTEGTLETMIQVEGLEMKPFSPATAENDRPMFSTTVYESMSPDAATVANHFRRSPNEIELAADCEKLTTCYLQKWKAEIAEEKWNASEQRIRRLGQLVKLVDTEAGESKQTGDDEGRALDEDQMKAIFDRYPESIDLQILSKLAGQVQNVAEEKDVPENWFSDDLVAQLYKKGHGFSQGNEFSALIMQQLVHRYPHLKIIELGARAGRTTASILDSMGGKFLSYTCTDPSKSLNHAAAESWNDSNAKLTFKTFNSHQTPADQELVDHTYDVVIASQAMFDGVLAPAALENVRRLLKPGGYLVASVTTTDIPIWNQFVETVLQGGSDQTHKGNKLGPVSMVQLHGQLRDAGFSGIDSATSETERTAFGFSVIVSQAVDERIQFLRKPLTSPSPFTIEELVIVGNKSLNVTRLADEVRGLLSRHCGKVTVLNGLPSDDDRISSMATFINLADVDEAIFANVSAENVEGLKCLFEFASNILWITTGARTDKPFHNASIGFGRSIAYEMPHLSLQFLDLDQLGSNASQLISEAALRLFATRTWDDESNSSFDMLWSRDPEIYVENGRLLVPRLLPESDQNARMNSSRRKVTKKVNPRSAPVFISRNSRQSIVLQEDLLPPGSTADQDIVHVKYSFLSTINVAPDTFLYLGAGVSQKTGSTSITLDDTNSSRITPSIQVVVDAPQDQLPRLLEVVSKQLIARSLLSRVPVNARLMIHGLEEHDPLASILTERAKSKRIELNFSTIHPTKATQWIQIAPWTSRRIAEQSLRTDTTHFLDFSLDEESADVGGIIRQFLPDRAVRIALSDMLRAKPLVLGEHSDLILEALEEAVELAKSQTANESAISAVRLDEASDASVARLPTSVIDRSIDAAIDVQVQPINAARLFAKNKTYLLVGLSGQLGRSICEWMSQNGAGCICLTSRKPNPDVIWQAELERQGTTVKYFAMDVIEKRDVNRVVEEIRSSCPPIAGVANGAALFHDVPFSEMSVEVLEKVMKPKVNGTRNLDEVFGDTPLEFFIVFSSLTSVLGNSGQSNYTAANAYMTGLVGQRRKRGLAATSLDIGSIIGIGYMERAGDSARDQLVRYGFMPISETDLHQLLAEAIRAGKPNSGLNPVITTGCRTVEEGEEQPVKWIDDPRLQHKVVVGSSAADAAAGNKKSALPVREQLATAKTTDEALAILKDCFAAKVAQISQLPDSQVGHDIPLVELGIDSLVAVEVRGWFLKELKTDVPVLKVLGGNSVKDLCENVVERLPGNLLPSLGDVDSSKAPTPKAAAKPEAKPTAKPATKPAAKSTTAPSSTATPTDSSSSSEHGDSSASSSPPRTPSEKQAPSTPGTLLSRVSSSLDLQKSAKSSKPANEDLEFIKTELVSYPQSRFWFLGLLLKDHTTFNVAFYFRVTGLLRTGDLERAVRIVTDRHESLRTCFVAHEKEADLAYQKVMPSSRIRLETKQISSMEDVDREYAAMKQIPFDLASGKLMRLILLALSPTEHYLLVNYHHILMDGVSLQNFLAELEKAYQRQPLGPSPCQVPEFSRLQRAAVEDGTFDDDIAYWKKELSGEPPVLPLLPMASINSRVPRHTFDVHQVECRISKELMAKVRETAKTQRSTTFHFYLSAFKVMLFRFTDADDLTIGLADANRIKADVMGTIGLLLNLLTLRFKRDKNQTLGESIGEARAKTLEALEHSEVPFDMLLNELNVPRSSSYSPFFQAFFDYRQGHQEKMSFGRTEFEFLEVHPGRTAYDMTLDITDSADSARILFRTQSGLYNASAAQLMLDTYVHILEVVTSDKNLKLEEFPLYSDKERKRAIEVGHGPNLKSSWNGGTLPHRIDQVAKENASEIALRDGHGRELTYEAMIDRIEAIASSLQEVGVKEGSRVLVFEDATADWPCSMLAIMRLGAVYIPLDLRNPLPRLADVAQSCRPAAVLVDDSTVESAPKVNVTSAQVVNVSKTPLKPKAHVQNVSRGDAVAAILYTSGSTGKPKGIVVSHGGLRNEIEGYTSQWGLGAERVLQQSAFTFNHSSDQMYTGLVNGGTVYIVPWAKRGDPIEVTKIIRDEGITYTKATPAEYSLWLDYGGDALREASSWRFAFGGGESLNGTLLKGLATLDLPELRFFNSYGPTEISISSTKMGVNYREAQPEGRIPCGFMLPNYAAYILDEQRQPLPIGMPGELWIGGGGVSLGYLDNPELTEKHFTHNPYARPEYVEQGWTRMYRTGDIAHLQHDGAMVFHNRIAGDSQVKIRGLRIELEDIESNILKASNGALKEAAVTLRENDPPMLIAHVVFAPRHQVDDPEAFLEQLLAKLEVPQYMVPVMAIPLERMPLTTHSKTDRKALKALALPRKSKRSDENVELSETMIQLKKLWENVLNTKALGLDITPQTSLFTIGGNSLLIVRLQSRIRQVFKVTVPLVELLDASTLGGMAQKIEKSPMVDSIDWDKETTLPQDLSLPRSVEPSPIKETDKVILVTGAGGFLGKHILNELLAIPNIAKIHCIGLRDKPGNSPRQLAISSPKIIAHGGNLSEPWLGLGEEGFAALAGQADAILHMAATRPFWDNYSLLSHNNVEPARQMVRLAAQRRIPFHYVSSAGVTPEDVEDFPAASVAEYPPAANGSNGYVASRWTCEQILEKAATELQIPVTVHRFVPAKQLADDKHVTDAMQHFVGFVDKMSSLPDFSGVTGHFEMTHAQKAAQALATGLAENSKNTDSVAFVHHECDIRINIADMEAFLTKERGGEVSNFVPVLRFIGDMKRAGLSYFVTSQELLMVPGGGKGTALKSRR